MASIDYSRPAAQISASEVLAAVVLELRELRASYKEVTNRIRILRGAVQALRELESAPGGEQAEGSGFSRLLPGPNHGIQEPVRTPRILQKRRPRGKHNPQLRRACRIALMETTDAVSEQEIHRRIVRRGSFCFANPQSAAHDIAEELNTMVEEGELYLRKEDPQRLWQRISRSHDAEEIA